MENIRVNKKTTLIVAMILIFSLSLTSCSVSDIMPKWLAEILYDCATCCDMGEIECDTCGGDKKYICNICDGNGENTCLKCGGTGEWLCYRCHGTGFTTDYNLGEYKWHICYKCMGSGKVDCPKTTKCDCEDGKLFCDKCSNSGRVDCPDC